jgi:hypothetical protein
MNECQQYSRAVRHGVFPGGAFAPCGALAARLCASDQGDLVALQKVKFVDIYQQLASHAVAPRRGLAGAAGVRNCRNERKPRHRRGGQFSFPTCSIILNPSHTN